MRKPNFFWPMVAFLLPCLFIVIGDRLRPVEKTVQTGSRTGNRKSAFASDTTPSTGPGKIAQPKFQNRRAVSPTTNSVPKPTYLGLTPERAHLLWLLGNIYKAPSPPIQVGRPPFKTEEVISLHPYLAGSEQASNVEALRALYQRIQDAEDKVFSIRLAQDEESKELKDQLRREQGKAMGGIAELSRELEYGTNRPPFKIIPAQGLLALNPAFGELTQGQLQSVMDRFAHDQTDFERGLEVSKVQQYMNADYTLKKAGIQLDEDGLRWVLTNSLDRIFYRVLLPRRN